VKELERHKHPTYQLDLVLVEDGSRVEVLAVNGASPDVSTVTLGFGADRQAAVEEAVANLEWLHDTLQGPPPTPK
jgi:hypothetical protein